MYESIKADLLFTNENFIYNGIKYTCTGEPWITGPNNKEKVHIPCRRMLRNTNHILTVPLNTLVQVAKEPVR